MTQQLRNMEVQMARERADFARQRSELNRLYEEIRREMENVERNGMLNQRLGQLRQRVHDVAVAKGHHPGSAGTKSNSMVPGNQPAQQMDESGDLGSSKRSSFLGRIFG
jgi:hypothetical protein